MTTTRLARLAAWGAALFVTAGSALAQDAPRLPRIDETPAAPTFWMYAVAVLLLGAVVFAASLKSKRTHQD